MLAWDAVIQVLVVEDDPDGLVDVVMVTSARDLALVRAAVSNGVVQLPVGQEPKMKVPHGNH
jgi:hypothetical protein